ncbi:phage holin family protein [Methylobacterium sp. J-092]|uniref:phage holin family protein n=1 Tax=Methylobacterium sp. J-092 TaxID=2836667 RepID=UPI001FB8630B|nr:phage holin family protein [Methylobacterium sp. J-092]MCJ2006339.1 phage holin family protein [Methylobacterium sp. J-092]
MSAVPPPQPPGGLQGLLAEALRAAGDVVRGEIALFRQEMTNNLRSLIVGLAAMTGAPAFALVGFLILVDALVTWLATVVGSEALATLIAGVVFLVIGIVLALAAERRFSLNGLMPTRTGRQLRQDATVIKEHVDA